MTVTIKFQREVRQSLQVWYRSLGDSREDRQRIGDMYIDAMIQHLIEFAGRPPEAIQEAAIFPPRYWWEFARGFWVSYAIEEEGSLLMRSLRKLFGGRVLKITILSLGRDRPNRAI